MKSRLSAWLTVVSALAGLAAGPRAQSTPQAASPVGDAEIQALLDQRLVPHSDTGIVVGIIGPTGRRIVVAGQAGPNGAPALYGHTVFEIGSATKVFTTALLMDMVRRGEVRLDDPVAKYLPP